MTTTVERRPEAATGLLMAARARRRAADAAEADLLQLAVDWAVLHPAESIHDAATHTLRGFGETDLPLAGAGAPTVAEFCVAEFAVVVGLPTEAGKRYLGEALELCYRLPRVWRRVASGDLPAWKARLVARETIRLTAEAATFVDRHVAPVAHRVRTSQLDLADALDFEAAVADGAAQRAALGFHEPLAVRRAQAVGDLSRRQLALDLAAATDTPVVKPRRVVLHVHLSEAALGGHEHTARLEQGRSLVTVAQVRDWCGNPAAQVVVKPMLDLEGCVSVDSYEVPHRISEQVSLRDATCVFPWCTRAARRCDCDHTVAHSAAGVTCSCNLAPLCRRHHRLKTHSPWSYLTLDPGRYLWTSPHGYQFLRDHRGTTDVSRHRPPLARPPDI